ncbi:type I-C CRISPR-associated protein Cas8c/Csd1 [Caproicibacter fermentans]|uniref:Type I-C CRISPR-associated protein Cas8c/Csd1 n=1 Tax=Caproicibacter fermentans TaxID=2576756 RepID=A0A7G8T7Y0_9FIRM|nr:type I-C CRISPR-associated protein Cas8c/Csd1 [Caproicibacter fermentans]QNK39721.1 type I-C CRISPR-associated protein Cas8c/Csd1 [Caproicibacter fermentans]
MLRALSKYYDCLCRQKDSGLVPDGYSKVGVNYNLVLHSNGTIKEILPYTKAVLNGKKEKEVPRDEFFPFRNSVPGISAETIDHREKYLFGIEWDKKNEKLSATKNSLLAFEKCKEKNLSFLEGLSSPIIDAYKIFLQNWNPENELDNPFLTALGKKYGGAKFIVTSQEDPAAQRPLSREAQVKEKWENDWRNRPIPADAVLGQCSISGKYGQIARIHDNLTGISGGLATGVNIVCLKSSAFWSYGRRESYNSSVSQEIMEKYTKAFNYLTSVPAHKQMLDGMTLLFWAMTAESEKPYLQAFNTGAGFFSLPAEDPSEAERNERQSQEQALASVFSQLSQGKEADWKGFGIDQGTEFYILGVKPNSSRLAIKIFEHNSFGTIMDRIQQHHRDMQLSPADKQMPIWLISKALKSPIASKDPLPPDLSTKILQSILRGSPYPRFMLETAVRRAKTDQDDAAKKFYAVSRDRVRIIKACLTRMDLIKRSEFTMLNTQNTDGAYNCGRLFAVLEMIQQKALPGINTTIKDRFFSSACSTPYLVFPRLLKLSQSHFGKLDRGNAIFFDQIVQEIVSNLGDSFPKAMNMEKQGMFILGYYQQKEKIFAKKSEGEKDNEPA